MKDTVKCFGCGKELPKPKRQPKIKFNVLKVFVILSGSNTPTQRMRGAIGFYIVLNA